jgi:hypothetical protein
MTITPAAVVTFEELDEIETRRLRAAGIELMVALFGSRSGPRATDTPEQGPTSRRTPGRHR